MKTQLNRKKSLKSGYLKYSKRFEKSTLYKVNIKTTALLFRKNI